MEVLEQLVNSLRLEPGPLRAQEMPGGASTRRFYRVPLGEGRSSVAMFVPDVTRGDEIDKHPAPHRWPFLEVRDLLEASGLPVPELLAEACDDGFVLVEDLGDDTLARFVARVPERRQELYQLAVRDIAKAQRSLSELPDGHIVSNRRFDVDLLRWELDHFLEWGLLAQGVQLSARDTDEYAELAGRLAGEIALGPQSFVHRDFQSRNLMVRAAKSGKFELVWIDFQDALMGPRVYDLVALLNDSYQEFSREFVEARLDEYVLHLGGGLDDRRAVGLEFNLVTVQRKLKDAGRFVFIDQKRNDPGFLRFVRPTIEKARMALHRLPPELGYAPLERFMDLSVPVSPPG